MVCREGSRPLQQRCPVDGPGTRHSRLWASSGAPEGNPADAPAPLNFTEGWTIGQPDVVLETAEDFEVQYVVVPTGFSGDRTNHGKRCP